MLMVSATQEAQTKREIERKIKKYLNVLVEENWLNNAVVNV